MKKHPKKPVFPHGMFYHPSLHHPSMALMPAGIVLMAILLAGVTALAGFLEQVIG